MQRFLVTILLSLTLLLISSAVVFGYADIYQGSNNKFGIHLFNEEDLVDAANLVNSNGGDWGYVTFVINESERDRGRWQKAFDKMRKLHLIPIVRIASKQTKDGWSIPSTSEIDQWASFLNSLNWVTQNRYVIVGNEPNHAGEWGGKLNPEEYAKYLKEFSSKLKGSSSDYFILPAALDSSARNTSTTMDETKYFESMVKSHPDLFDYIDGWNSHSYPNPEYSGSELAKGRGTVTNYDWELNFLNNLGLSKKLPVFITETGWSTSKLSEDEIGRRIESVSRNVWTDSRIVAITPFILNYPQDPFRELSWKRSDGSFRSYFQNYKDLPKNKGEPAQIESGQILAAFAQPIASIENDFGGVILARNTGQTIWAFNNISIGSLNGRPFIKSYSFNELEPTKLGLIVFRAEASDKQGLYLSSLYLKGREGSQISNSFLIESVILDLKKVNIGDFFGRILGVFGIKGP